MTNEIAIVSSGMKAGNEKCIAWPIGLKKQLGPVVRKPINLIPNKRKLLFRVFNFLVKVCFAYFCFSRLTSSNVKFGRISVLNSIWE